MNVVLITALFALVLAFILGLALGFFKQFFAVEQDPLIGQIRECLPGANCGGCGFPGCDGYAAAVASKEAGIDRCSVGGAGTVAKLSALMGVSGSVQEVVAVLACRGSKDLAPLKGIYTGVPTCRGAKLSAGGTKLCAWGCLGYGDCVKVCPFGALSLGGDGLPQVDAAKCAGCKLCVAECPQGLLQAAPKARKAPLVYCSNRNPVKAQVLKTCKAGCIKCELCVKKCPQQCIVMDRGIPKIDYEKCNACGTCAAGCPTKAIAI